MNAAPKLFDRWREADGAARVAEKEVLAASLEALDGKGPAPSMQARERAKRLRAVADAMLNAALASLTVPERAAKSDREGPDPRPWR
jgi:hypothetical protein